MSRTDRGDKTMKRPIAATLLAVTLAALALAPAARAEFGIQPGSFTAGSFRDDGAGVHAILGEGATPDARAAAHPFLAATAFSFNTFVPPAGGTYPDGAVKDVVVELPPGFLGNPNATPRCQQAILNQTGTCPLDTVIGVVNIPVVLGTSPGINPSRPDFRFYLPVYNMEPGFGEPALIGSYVANPSLPILIRLRLDSQRNYAITATVANINNIATAYASSLAVWGVPADSSHDPWRGTTGEPESGYAGGGCLRNRTPSGTVDTGPESIGDCPSETQPARPFLINPAACDGQPVRTTIHVDSWQQHGRFDSEGNPDLSDPTWKTDVADAPPVTGCDQLNFGGPEAPVNFTDEPAGTAADAPSGHEMTLTLPYNEDPDGLANPTLRDTVVDFAPGVTVNPSAAAGLAACTSEQIGLTTPVGQFPARFDGAPVGCPEASKIGNVEAETPLLDHDVKGALYQAKQGDNPFGSLLAVYIVIDDPETGTLVKLPGEVEADEQTGRLTARFTETPQLPVTDFRIRVKGGQRAPLVNPRTCGAKATSGEFTPWSAPSSGPPATTSDSFVVSGGASGCPSTLADRPFDLAFSAGTVNPVAGAHSPFTLRLTRPDGRQELDRVNVTVPEGMVASLRGVPYCSEAGIVQAIARTNPGDGALEQAAPSCPAASQVGTTTIGAGAGTDPFYVSGNAYLAGPYKGAPLSLAFVVPAVAGPFDLGVQTVRTALHVDPRTAQITALSDPIPQMLEGIPLRIRDVRVDIDRESFTLNPTSCEAKGITAQVFGSHGALTNLANRFQVGDCAALDFEPHLKLNLLGGTKRAAYQGLRAVLNAKPGEANIARTAVTMPRSAFLAQEHIRTVCTRVQWAADNCPKGARYGHATAWSPLLDEALTGPVYLRSSDNLLPDLVADLRGPAHRPIRIELVGRTDSVRGALRNTFDVVPDAPVRRFVLRLFGGKRGLIVNSRDICRGANRARIAMRAHSGKRHDFRPVVRNGRCAKQRKRARAAKRHSRRSNQAARR